MAADNVTSHGAVNVSYVVDRRVPKLVAVALANKMARIAWKLMATGQSYVGKSTSVAMAKVALRSASARSKEMQPR